MQPNPQLQPLAILIGEWTTRGSHPLLPGADLRGRATFEWAEGGAFLLARTHIDHPQVPDGVWLVGTDDAHPSSGCALYFDSRTVSREYRWTLSGNLWTWTRNAPDLSQRIRMMIADDGRSIVSTGEMSRDGTTWEPDLELTYTASAS